MLRSVACCLLLMVCLCTHSQPDRAAFRLSNGFIRVEGVGPVLTRIEVDPSGTGRYEDTGTLDLRAEGLARTNRTRAIVAGQRVRLTNLAACLPETLEIKQGGVADQLQPDHTLGQQFTWKRGTFNRVEALLPVWATQGSGGTLSLLRAPGGAVIASRQIRNAPDNAWQELTCEPQGPGEYVIQLSEPVGTYGWWSARDRKGDLGPGLVDGKPVTGVERAIKVHGQREVGAGHLVYSLDGPQLTVAGELRIESGASLPRPQVTMHMRWDNSGYDVTAAAVPFSRFFSDQFRYMPVQQLKRWSQGGGWYDRDMTANRWIEADGTGAHDLRFGGQGLYLRWYFGGEAPQLIFASDATNQGGLRRSEFTLRALPREDGLPADWPRISLPDGRTGREASLFFYERAFTYGPVWGPGAWLEWNALGRLWHAGPHVQAIRDHLGSYPMTDEGYVHTWGGAQGWPFPDNAKYDTRHFDTNARFILACRRYALWTGDTEFLRAQAERLRRAMHYQLTVLKGADGLIIAASKDVNGKHEGVGNNYWDILPFGHLDAYANAVWYASLGAMADIERLLQGIEGLQTSAPVRTPEEYLALAEKARAAYSATFWDDQAGRYIGCVDIDGKRHDYGFTFVNLEAMAYGLADPERVERIYHWMETAVSSDGEADMYSKWIFAPRANQVHNPQWRPGQGKIEDVPQDPWWHFGWLGTPFNDQCQDGGAILYTSFFDLVARARYLGADNAWQRWEAILERRRMPDLLCGGAPLSRGENPQLIDAGAVGVDIPFPESSMVPCWLVYSVAGVEPTLEGLRIRPNLPASLPWIEVERLAYRGLPLTLRADRRSVRITCKQPGYAFTWRARLDANGEALFTAPPAPVQFPEQPVWSPRSNWRASWIWHADLEAPLMYARKALELPAQPTSARVTVTADNGYTLYVNGQRVASGDNWSVLTDVDIAAQLRPGRNVIAARAENAGGPGGLLLQGTIHFPGGKTVSLATDATWRISADAPAEEWMEPGFDDAPWPLATAHFSPPAGPWGQMGEPPSE